MNFFKNILGSQWFHSLYHAVVAGAIGYLSSASFAPTKTWAMGLAAAVLGAIVGWLNGNSATPSVSGGPSVAKTSVFFLVFLLAASMANADWVITSPKARVGAVLSVSDNFPANGQVDLCLIQTSALGFSIGSGTPVYGYSGGYELLLAKYTGQADGVHSAVVPLLGIGLDAFVDAADAINSGLNKPVRLLLGGNIMGPQLQQFAPFLGDLVPQLNANYDFDNKAYSYTVGLAAPLGLLEDDGIKKVAGPF